MANKILFVYQHQYPKLWKDGLFEAIEILGWDKINLATQQIPKDYNTTYDLVVGWGAFGSKVEHLVGDLLGKKALCIAGNAIPPKKTDRFDILFYETKWYHPRIAHHPNTVHAFGTNTKIYKPMDLEKLFDVIGVGSFSYWKRWQEMIEKDGVKLVIGEVQEGNPRESLLIANNLLMNGVIASPMVTPEKLARFYNHSHKCFIPATINGGGERAVLEARACGLEVEVSPDNEKLKELLTCPLWDQNYYVKRLEYGVSLVL